VIDSHCVQTADGSFCRVTHQGNLATSQFTVPGVSLVPKLSMNLISVGQLTDMHCFVVFYDTSCFVQDRRTRALLGIGHRHKGDSGLYILDHLHLPSPTSPVSSSTSSISASAVATFPQWHHRLGHLCGSRLSTLVSLLILFLVLCPLTPLLIVLVVNLANKYNCHILLVHLKLVSLLILFTQMSGSRSFCF
jgi:hypothetical protein